MFRIDDPTAATSLPVPEAAGTEGYFTEGNPVAGTAATLVRGSFLNMIQEELRAIVVAGGLVPSKTTYNQVLAAIRALGKQSVTLADTGAVNAYTAVNPTPLVTGTWINGVVQQVIIAHTNTGPSTYAPDGLTAIPIFGLGLQALQGNELFLGGTAVLMKATIAGVNSGNPICVLMECAGGAQQVPLATQSQQAMQLGQATGRLLRTSYYVRAAGVQNVSINGATFGTTGASSFIPLAATTQWKYRMWGGGGGGGGTANNTTGGGGGGGSAYIEALSTVLGTQTITVGTGGAGGSTSGTNGSSGTTSSIGAIASANGGGGGNGSTTGGGGGASGASTAGAFSIPGQGGQGGLGSLGGTGGSGYCSYGGLSHTASTADAGGLPGGGGGGGGSIAAGGAGGSGLIIIEEYA